MKGILAKDGVKGLFGRGLQTRLMTNMAQSMVFSVGWKARASSRPLTAPFPAQNPVAALRPSAHPAAPRRRLVPGFARLPVLPKRLAGVAR